MLAAKNNEQQIYSRKEKNLFFGVFCHPPKERKHHGSIFVLLLGACLCALTVPDTSLADFTASDSSTLGSIHGTVNESLGQLRQIQWNTDSIEGDLETLHDDMSDVHRYMEATVSGNRVGNWPNLITGGSWGQNPLSILQQLDYMRYNLVQVTNLMVKLASTNDYTKAFTNTINAINSITEQTDLVVKNLGNLANGYALEDSEGSGYENRISATHYGNSSISMSDALQFIAQGVGGIDTGGNPHYQTQAMMPLINTIIGWNGGFANSNIQTNGIIGLLRQSNKYLSEVNSMTNLVVDKISEQINIISNGFAKVCLDLFPLIANNQTNLMWSTIMATDPPYSDPAHLASYGLEGHNDDGYNVYRNNGYNNWLYYLPLYLVPFEDGYDFIHDYYNDGYHTMYSLKDYTEREQVKNAFYKYYGNMRTYEAAYGYEEYEQSQIYDSASNLVRRTSGGPVTNSIADALLVVQGIPALNQDVSDIEDIGSDYKHFKGPSEPEVKRISQYFSDAQIKSQNKAGFEFSVDFGNVSEEGGPNIEIVNRELLDGVNIQTIAASFQPFITYGVSIFKGILLLCFVWHCAEKAISLLNGGIQND